MELSEIREEYRRNRIGLAMYRQSNVRQRKAGVGGYRVTEQTLRLYHPGVLRCFYRFSKYDRNGWIHHDHTYRTEFGRFGTERICDR